MSKIESTKLRKGAVFTDDGKTFQVIDYSHTKKGRGLATVRVKVRDLESKAVLEKTYSSNEKVESAELNYKSAQFLYSDENKSYFMDTKDYSQFELKNDLLEDHLKFLTEGIKVRVQVLEEPVGILIPKTVTLSIKYTEPGIAGDTASGATKEAELETGLTVQVPLFIDINDKIVVNTDSCEYVSKA